MKLSEVTAKEFLNTMKDPDLAHRAKVLADIKVALNKAGFDVAKVRRKLAKSPFKEIYFQVPGITNMKHYEKAKAIITNALPKDKAATITQSWFLANDYSTPLGYASFFVSPE